jgi:hypothetical protein
MTTTTTMTTHQGGIHVDPSVETVFAHVKDRWNLFGASPQELTVSDDQMAPDLGEQPPYKVTGRGARQRGQADYTLCLNQRVSVSL